MPVLTRSEAFELLKQTGSQWNDHNAPRLGAALAYYALLSTAPLFVLIVAICGLAFDKNTAKDQLLTQVQSMVGPPAAKAMQSVLENAHQKGSGILASIIALITLLFGASGVFVELRDSLNTIWDAPSSPSSSWRNFVWQRLVSFAMVLALGFLLLVSLVLSAILAVIINFFEGYLPLNAAIWGEVANFALPLIAISILFALIFKFVPDVPINWRDVIIGAIVTAVLFEIGKALLALYLATTAVGSPYGAAGSIVAFVVWVYYSAQIFFFGAIFTHVYANTVGSHSTGSNSKPVSTSQNLSPAQRGASA
ncbi:MAG: YihY/virulence factor BrkB family protein [Acidobacteriaceae bacterium]|nr:YihY/virulence factor BrkB family protein [Acidobacteriaceae bacterium]